MARLADKLCLVTGAARGIGLAIARAFHAEGAQVILTDIDAAEGQAAADALGARFIALDVADEGAWDALEREVPRLDVLVNNAGITGLGDHGHAHDPENTPLSEWRRVHQINLDGAFLGCRYAIRAMKAAGKGSIINMSSRSGLVGIPGAAAYASSKAAIRNHTKSVALYCAGQGWTIRCNSIHPAAILTPIWEQMIATVPDREAALAAMVADTPLRRFGRTDEVAALAVLLASDEATYITGSELGIDGGLLAGSAASPK